MGRRGKETLERVAAAITDETPIEWAAERSSEPDLAARLQALNVVEKIAEVYRNPWRTGAASPEPLLLEWGHLRVVEKLGEGGGGAVYRANDPHLRRDVALKLLRADLSGRAADRQRFVEEAQRLARVRHPNIVVVHGAEEHDGRVGFWFDLVRGETLEKRLALEGPVGPGEAAVIGIDLCRALAAVHQAGLIHGDVKTSNVMRDRQGRIVLTDFGAGSEQGREGGRPPWFGTPLTLAPELLDGAPSGPSADLYALGVMLFRLVCGRYPVEGTTLDGLRARHRSGERLRLLDLRPDLPAEFAHVVEKAIAENPSGRFPSAGEMEAALAALFQGDRVTPPSLLRARRQVRRGLIGAVAMVVLLAVTASLWLVRLREPGRVLERSPAQSAAYSAAQPATRSAEQLTTPAIEPTPASVSRPALEIEATLYRSRGGAREALPAGALVRPGDRLFVEIQESEPASVYVLNEDQEGRVYLLFPLPGLDLQNPLPAGDHRLPGTRHGALQDWQVTEGKGAETFLLVAAREPVPLLEQRLAKLPRAESGRDVSPAPFDPKGLLGQRGVGGMVPSIPGEPASAGTMLSAIARELTVANNDPGGLWIREISVHNLGR